MKDQLAIITSKKLQSVYVVRNIFIASALLLCYSGILALLLSPQWINMRTVNYEFSIDFVKISLAILVLSVLIFAIIKLKASRQDAITTSRSLAPMTYVWVSLLPLSAVFRYVIANRDIASLFDAVLVVIIFVIALFVFVVGIPYILGRFASDRMLLSVVSTFFFLLLNMASISQTFHWLEEGSSVIQVLLFAVTFVGMWLLLGVRKNDLIFVTVVFFLGSIVFQVVSSEERQQIAQVIDAASGNHLVDAVGGREPQIKPNIYLLIYDSYVANETMLNYGINNSDQEHYLIDQGFQLYPHTYSTGSYSLASMNAVMNISGSGGISRVGVDGNGRVHEFLRSLEYQVFGIFGTDYFFRGLAEEPNYDHYTPQSSGIPVYQLIAKAVWIGEFRFDLELESVSHLEYVSLKREVFANPPEDPFFVYSHSMVPGHSQNSGVCLPNEVDLYIEDLETANEEMRQDIDTIIANDPAGIIIVAGDHGPSLTKNCYSLRNAYQAAEVDRIDLQDRYGTFLAIRWPTNNYQEYDRIAILQDIFPAVLSWMYRDTELLDLRTASVTSDGSLPAGVEIHDGIILGGVDDGEPLFLVDIAD